MKFLVRFTGYDAHYPNPNVVHETIMVEKKAINLTTSAQIAHEIMSKRGFSRVVIDGWEEEK
jgi:hypothetical protein